MKEYLSYSQLKALENGTYVKLYIWKETFTNAGMEFGKRFADAREKNEFTGDPLIDFGLVFLPRYQYHEHKIDIDGLHGRLDGFNEPNLVNDDKTGKTKWTQAKVDKDSQLTFYALLVDKKYGKIPDLELHHLSPDFQITHFKTKRTRKQLKEMEKRIKKALKIKKEIHELYES